MIEEKISIREQLQQALEAKEFILYYQPLMDTESERIVAAEALVRWKHPRLGILEPLRFIPGAGLFFQQTFARRKILKATNPA